MGVDSTRIEVTRTGRGYATAGIDWRSAAVLQGEARLGFVLSRGWSLRLAATVEVDLQDTRYVVRAPQGAVPVFDPFRLWPGVVLGLAWQPRLSR
jgi:hypothetical protein